MNDDGDGRATKIGALRAAIDEGLAELDAGLGVETSPGELVAEILAELAGGDSAKIAVRERR